jgi:hypothetical protein
MNLVYVILWNENKCGSKGWTMTFVLFEKLHSAHWNCIINKGWDSDTGIDGLYHLNKYYVSPFGV